MLLNDRGTKKWNMAYFIPEHKERVRQIFKEEEAISKPILDEQKEEELNLLLAEAMKHHRTIELWIKAKKILEYEGRFNLALIIEKEIVDFHVEKKL